jgi:hypothetical protein
MWEDYRRATKKRRLDLLARNTRVKLTRNIDLSPHSVLEAGEKGTVTKVDENLGHVEVRMDDEHRGLAAWDNQALLAEDDVTSLKPLLPIKHFSKLGAAFLGAALAVGLLADVATAGLRYVSCDGHTYAVDVAKNLPFDVNKE